MSFLGTGFGGASSSYSITNSVRFNGTSDYLTRTLTTSAATSGSVWVKRSKLGAASPIFDNKVYFTSGDALYAFGLTSTTLYRDPSAWYHVFWNGTGVYVNGTLVTGSGSYTAASVTNPRMGYDGSNYFSGYLSDFAFWDGTSASLQGGATDSNGVWAARRPSAGYSFLAFGSSGALGTDTSGNGNNWTVSGSPVQTTDTPTNNYCTLNSAGPLGDYTVSNGAMTAAISGATGQKAVYGTLAFPSDSSTDGYYFEITWTSHDSYAAGASYTGVAGIATGGADSPYQNASGATTGSSAMWGVGDDGQKYSNQTGGSLKGSGLSNGLVTKYAVKNGKLWIGDTTNGWYASGDPAAGTNAAYTNLTGYVRPFLAHSNNSSRTGTWVLNAGQTAFAGTPPTGFKALCTANLTSTAVTTSGTFTGNANADGPFIWTNGNPATLTINGNAVTFGTHADKTAGGFKLRTSSASYNTSGSNTWTATAGKRFVYSSTSINTSQGNP